MLFDFEIAHYLYRVAFLYEKIHNSPYKARAYFKAALAVDGYSTNIEKLHCEGKLRTLPSIGVSIEKNINEIIQTGHLTLIDELLGNIPASIFSLFEHANIKDKLLKTLINNKILDFTLISNIIEQGTAYLSSTDIELLSKALKDYNSRQFQYAQVYELAKELILFMQNSQLIHNVSISDDLFSHKEVLAAGDIICTLTSDFNVMLDRVRNFPFFNFVSADDKKIILERFGIQFQIHILSEEEFGKKMQELQTIQRGKEIQIDNKKIVPHFYGDLHLHTDWSDGLHSIEQMRDMALELGYSYIAITDHSQSLKPSGMSELDTLTQIKKIRSMNTESAIPILSGIEVDILADGSLDLPDNILKEFDIVIASIHSHFNQGTFVLMDRIEKALSNKYVNVLAHPTGRLLGRPGKPTVQRKEMELIFDSLLQFCKNHNVALELNCFPERFDLSLDNVKKAIKAGVKISIGTDSHSMYHMECAKYALEAFKFINVPVEAVLNYQPLADLKKILTAKRNSDKRDIASIFEEKFKDFKHYFSDNKDILSGHIKSVGIDLTGSEEKASGFATLSGTFVETIPVLTDDEMVERILKVKPDIVSIDSPLSLPQGRCCGNKNCDCAKHGIMRYCELTLKRFGIGVYPCLIDSMVNLTMRGMKLSERLRKLGLNVIESYPGVAQDMLHIPRKRKGLELLLSGMKNFGIKGIREDITHDEADAITSALVGYFYLDHKYVGMGNKEEDYLIVPKLETDLTGKGIIIGLVGRIAAGKTTVAEYMCFKYGFSSMRYSKVIAEKYNVSGREKLQQIGFEISKDKVKQKELSDIMISKMKKGENYVIDGIRQTVDYETLLSEFGNKFTMLYIEAPFQARSNRYCKSNPNVSKDEFAEIDAKPVEGAIGNVSYKSNYKIDNNKNYRELMKKLDSFFTKLTKQTINGGEN